MEELGEDAAQITGTGCNHRSSCHKGCRIRRERQAICANSTGRTERANAPAGPEALKEALTIKTTYALHQFPQHYFRISRWSGIVKPETPACEPLVNRILAQYIKFSSVQCFDRAQTTFRLFCLSNTVNCLNDATNMFCVLYITLPELFG